MTEVEKVEPVVEPVVEPEPEPEYDEELFSAWFNMWNYNDWAEVGHYESKTSDPDWKEQDPNDWINRYAEIKDKRDKRYELGLELLSHQIVMTDEVKKDIIEKMRIEKERQKEVSARIHSIIDKSRAMV